MEDIFADVLGILKGLKRFGNIQTRERHIKLHFVPSRNGAWTQWAEATAVIGNAALEFEAEVLFPAEQRSPLTGGTLISKSGIPNMAPAVAIEIRFYDEMIDAVQTVTLGSAFRKQKFIAGTSESSSASAVAIRCRSLSVASSHEVLVVLRPLSTIRGRCRMKSPKTNLPLTRQPNPSLTFDLKLIQSPNVHWAG
jgi:hypothetical protein